MNKKAFTLIELLVVVVIIALILVISVPAFRNARIENAHSDAMTRLIDLGTGARNYSIDYLGGHVSLLGGYSHILSQEDVIIDFVDGVENCVSPDTNETNINVSNLFNCGYAKPFQDTLATFSAGGASSSTAVSYNGYAYVFCGGDADYENDCCSASYYNTSEPARMLVMQSVTTSDGRYSAAGACAWMNIEGKVGNNYDLNAPL